MEKVVLLFNNYLVLLISFLSSTVMALGGSSSSSSPTSGHNSGRHPSFQSSRVSASGSSRQHPYLRPPVASQHQNPSGSQQLNSQGRSSSGLISQTHSTTTFDTLLQAVESARTAEQAAESLEGGMEAPERVSPRLPHLALPSSPLPSLAQPSLPQPEPRPMFPAPSTTDILSGPDSTAPMMVPPSQPLPPLSAPSVSFDLVDFTGLEFEKLNALEELDNLTVEDRIQKLREKVQKKLQKKLRKLENVLSHPQEKSLRLRLTMKYFSDVQKVFAQFDDPSSFPIIHLELHRFYKSSDFSFMEVLNFLETISPTLEKLFFIDSEISLELVRTHFANNNTLLQNIVELKFRRTKLASGNLLTLAQLMIKLEKLEHITLHLEKPLGENNQISLLSSMRSILKNNIEKRKSLTLAGSFFDKTRIGYFRRALYEFATRANLQELDISQIALSEEELIDILEKLNENAFFLKELKKLSISDISSHPRFKELQESLAQQRGDSGFQIVFGQP